MIALAYFGISIFFAYRVGNRGAGFGIAFFIASVVVWQLFNDGAGSFLEGGCQSYGHAARDC